MFRNQLPDAYQAGGEWGRDCRKPRNKPIKTVRFSPAKEGQERKEDKQKNPLLLQELAAKIRLEAYQVLIFINKLHLCYRWGQDDSGKKKMREGISICSL